MVGSPSANKNISGCSMTKNSQKIRFFRKRISTFSCKPGCHDCCGPVTASSEEVFRLSEKSDQEHDEALAQLNCPYLGENGCEIYDERPLICRLFGTTSNMSCPEERRPEEMIDHRIELKIYNFLAVTRQVLL
jgi:Fe-S-cluster containining protein